MDIARQPGGERDGRRGQHRATDAMHLLGIIAIEDNAVVCRAKERDPRSDPAAADVMAAYQAATQAGLPTSRCYRAGVEAWRRAHPDHAAAFAAKQAVAVILAAKEKFLLRVG